MRMRGFVLLALSAILSCYPLGQGIKNLHQVRFSRSVGANYDVYPGAELNLRAFKHRKIFDLAGAYSHDFTSTTFKSSML